MFQRIKSYRFSGAMTPTRSSLLGIVWLLGLLLPHHAMSQSACPADGESACKSSEFCVGLNTGFYGYAAQDRPFIDLARGAGLTVDGYTPNNVMKNAAIPLDENKYPTDVDRKVVFIFHSNAGTTHTPTSLRSGQYVVLWDGLATELAVRGAGVSNVEIDESAGRIEFSFDGSVVANTWFEYKNAASSDNVRNIHIVPKAYESDYAGWSWSDYEIGAASNPPIFFPEWLEKMSSACTIRYMNAMRINDADVVRFNRDSTETAVDPSSSVWYDGFGLADDAITGHRWPWHMVVESTIQTGANPWINFRVMAYENMIAGNSIVEDVATMFATHHDGKIYVEYGNEIWNTAYPFNVSTNHVRLNGPGDRDNQEENYALRSNAIAEAFGVAYGERACDVIGLVASQGRFPGRGRAVLEFVDLNHIDLLTPTTYFGDDLAPGNVVWNFSFEQYELFKSGAITKAEAFNRIQEELLTGSRGVITRNWRNDVGPFTQEYLDMAAERDMCTGFYEAGLHMRVNNVDRNDLEQVEFADFMRDYQRSDQQAAAEKEVHDWLLDRTTGPNLLFASFMNAGWGTFSYWDSVFEDRATESARASLLDAYGEDDGVPPVIRVSDVSVMEDEGVANVEYTLSKTFDQEVMISVFTRAGTAQPGEDFRGDFQKLTFSPGTTRATLPVEIIDDSRVEQTETFAVIGVNPVNGQIEGSSIEATVTIEDDDDVVEIFLDATSATVNESDGVAQVELTLSAPSPTVVRAYVYTQVGSSSSPALPGQDFWGMSRAVEFPAGETRITVPVTILNDTEIESEESFPLRVVNAVGATLFSPPTIATITITDDDHR